MGLEGQVAIVTGASRGLGRAIAEGFVQEGMRVVAAARSHAELEALAASDPTSIRVVRADMRRTEEVGPLVEVALESFGRLDVVVNNAGIAPAARFMETDLDMWKEILEVNLLAAVALTQAAGSHFIEQHRGKVINISSLSGLRGKSRLAAYGASKGAMLRMTESLAAEWAAYGIQVNAIAPGAFATEAQHAVLGDPTILERRLHKIPARRMAASEEIVPLACFLASPRSDFVTGATYVIDGGELNKL